jgi:FMN phosphatase YigB (HAD superfamily)
MSKIKVVAVDLIGTFIDPATINPMALDAYGRQLQQWRETRKYFPIVGVEGFVGAKFFPDALEFMKRRHEKVFSLVAASNVPKSVTEVMVKMAGGWFNHILEFHKVRKLKPSLLCYAMIPEELNCRADEVLFVTSNRGVGDDTEPKRLGMQTRLIDREAGETLLDLLPLL